MFPQTDTIKISYLNPTLLSTQRCLAMEEVAKPVFRVNTGGLSGRPGTIRDNANGFVGKNKPSAYITG